MLIYQDTYCNACLMREREGGIELRDVLSMYRATLIQASLSQQNATHDYHMTSLSQLGAPGPNDL